MRFLSLMLVISIVCFNVLVNDGHAEGEDGRMRLADIIKSWSYLHHRILIDKEVMAIMSILPKLLRVYLIISALVLLPGAYLWCQSPKALREVARVSGDWPESCTTGFLVQENVGQIYVLYDWINGKERWRINVDDPFGDFNMGRTSISSDGRFFAAVGYHTNNMCMKIWSEGKVISKLKWPISPQSAIDYYNGYGVMVWNDGRVLCWFPEKGGISLRGNTSKGQEITGHISCTLPRGTLPKSESIKLSPDGQLLLLETFISRWNAQAQCWDISVVGNRVLGKARALRASPDQRVTLFSDGVIIDQDGQVYTPSGSSRLTQYSSSTLQQVQGEYGVFNTSNGIAVYSPGVNKGWQIPLSGEMAYRYGNALTPDARYALVTCQDATRLSQLPPIVQSAVSLLPTRWSTVRGLKRPHIEMLLYERSGRLQATYPIASLSDVNVSVLSPDGHAVVTTVNGNCTLLRW